MKNIVPIAFCLDKRFMLLLKVAIDSLLRSSLEDTYYKIYIVSNDLTQDDRKMVDAIACRFSKSCQLIFREIDDSIFRDRKFEAMHGAFSYYYRFALHHIIPEHDKIIYSDADVIFCGDLAKYFAINLGETYLGGVQFDHLSYFTDDYVFDGKYFASGNLLMNLKACREIDFLGDIAAVAKRYRGRLRYYDQDCLNVMFYDQVTYLPLNFCVNHKLHQNIARDRYFTIHLRHYSKEAIVDAIKNPDIVHYTGPKPDKASPSCKFWQLACAQAGFIDEYLESVFLERQKPGESWS